MVFLFLYDVLPVRGNIVLEPTCIEQFIFVYTTTETSNFSQNSTFLVLLSGDAGGGAHMGTSLCQVRKPTTFTFRKTSTLSYSQKWARKFLLLSANRKSANS
jgi:hypothetical protein